MTKRRQANVERDDGDHGVDALFRLPLAEFTGARNTLAARLKKSGRVDEKAEAALVKALVKPSISAWAVNQVYWNHREAFDQLILRLIAITGYGQDADRQRSKEPNIDLHLVKPVDPKKLQDVLETWATQSRSRK